MPHRIKHLRHGEIDTEKWDLVVGSVAHPQPYGFSWFLNWVAPGWEAVIYGDYDAVLPIFPAEKRGLRFTTRPFGTQQLGPFHKIPLQSDLVQALLEAAMAQVRYGEFFLSAGTPLPEGCSAESLANFELHLHRPYDELYTAYSSQTKRNLKRAEKEKFSDAPWVGVGDALQLWKDHTQEKTAIDDAALGRLQKVLEFCHYQKRADVLAVRDEYNQLAAAQVWVRFQGRSTLLVNASSPWGKEKGAPTWLLDRYLHTWSGKAHVLDFEGSAIEGLARFYSGFGATNVPYWMHVENNLPFWARPFKPKSTRS